VAAVATLYTAFLLYAAGPKFVLVSLILYAPRGDGCPPPRPTGGGGQGIAGPGPFSQAHSDQSAKPVCQRW
ncbi:hypothetical protein, partial [Streptomyces sp. NPDC047974]|uniref:hypothetical protein n=1 Tax=Streptomyces sp. NPDC047974 TaxID=3154343 RepID=UPI0033D25C78